LSHDTVRMLISRWREDPGSTYQTWFLWEERLKNFRSIRRGIAAVVAEIEAGTFGNLYKGSPLETVVGSVAEQRQIFKGADHAFLWKPKLRIPDIYENRENQLAFGRFLHTCACCTGETQLLAAIHDLAGRNIKGLGPAAANLLYFLHPTLVPPSNTAIVEGYNAMTGAKVKLGKWSEYLAMREGDRTHTEIQGWLRDLGLALGYDVWIASNDRSRACSPGRLGDGCLEALPSALAAVSGAEAIRLIDVLWLSMQDGRVAAAFEVEHTTSIYSGIVRLLDLALGVPEPARGLYLVAPDDREGEVRAQLARPAFRSVADLRVRFLPYGELSRHREAIARFGEGLKAIDAVARTLA
jgi:type II restriction enzyme